MDIRKFFLASHAIMASAMIVALTFPSVAKAISIGEVVMQSKVGEPLFAQVDLVVGSGEHIENSCLALAPPDPLEDDASDYLTKANLSVKTEGARQYVVVSSRTPFNDAFAKLRLQIKCPGKGSIIKLLTILPDLVPDAQAPITAPVAAETINKFVPPPLDVHDDAHEANQRDNHESQPEVREYIVDKSARPTHKQPSPSVQVASKKQGGSPSFRLQLSGEPLDESRLGKASPEERVSLLAQKKLLDADDQMARFLAMRNQVQQLKDELGTVKLQLAQLGAIPPSSAASSAQMSPPAPLETAGKKEVLSKPEIAVTQIAAQQNDGFLKNGLWAVLGLVLVISPVWLGVRYYKMKKRIEIPSTRVAQTILKTLDFVTTDRNNKN